MPRLFFHSLTRMSVLLAVVVMATLGCEEPTDRSLQPPETESPAATAAPATKARDGGGAAAAPAGLPAKARTPAELRQAAEAGDVPSMLLLGRSHESLGQTSEARQWYQRAADAGSDEGKAALAQLDAPDALPATAPTALSGADESSSAAAPDASSTGRVDAGAVPPGGAGTLRWIDIRDILDAEDIVSDERVMPAGPNRAPGSDAREIFVGRASSRDGGIVVAAMGPTALDLDEVSAVIRVRNRMDPGTSPRVAQAGAVAARVTGNNVNQREFVEWVSHYLQSEQRSAPIFRNGWRITISGFAAEGARDPKPHLGKAVMIEMKK